jgi:hypothetical protein
VLTGYLELQTYNQSVMFIQDYGNTYNNLKNDMQLSEANGKTVNNSLIRFNHFEGKNLS